MIDFKTNEQRISAQEVLKQGTGTEFWKLIVRALEDSKADIQAQQDNDDLKDLSPEQYKFENEIYKVKKQFIDTLIKTPGNIVSWLEKPDSEREDFDPYAKPGEIETREDWGFNFGSAMPNPSIESLTGSFIRPVRVFSRHFTKTE